MGRRSRITGSVGPEALEVTQERQPLVHIAEGRRRPTWSRLLSCCRPTMATAASPIVIEPRPARIMANESVAMSTAVVTNEPIVVSVSRRRAERAQLRHPGVPQLGVPAAQRRCEVVGADLLGLGAIGQHELEVRAVPEELRLLDLELVAGPVVAHVDERDRHVPEQRRSARGPAPPRAGRATTPTVTTSVEMMVTSRTPPPTTDRRRPAAPAAGGRGSRSPRTPPARPRSRRRAPRPSCVGPPVR